MLWLPSVHYYFDAVAIRDTGTLWASLTWDLADKRHFLPAAILWHPEGPLQFLFLNAYYVLVGNWFPLKPLTTQVPNVLFASLGAFVVFRLVEKLHSRRLGYATALCFILMPWLGSTLRLPWVFNTLTCLLQATTLYGYTGYILQPQRRLYRVAAPDYAPIDHTAR